MTTPSHRTFLVLALAGTIAACGDDSTGPDETAASVQGVVEETTPEGEGSASAPAAAPGTDAETVAVVQIGADGSLTTVAEADVEADGSFTVEEVEVGLEDLAVVARVGERDAGRVVLYQSSSAGAVIRAAPINYETTAEARAWGEVRASGEADATSAGEIALLLHLEGAEAEALLASDAELEALAEGLVTAGETLTAIYAEVGAALDAEARADVATEAAIAFSESRLDGESLEAAHNVFVDAVLDGFIDAGVTLEETVMATAAAASTLDATVEESVTNRGLAVSEAVRLNLRARARLAAEQSSSAYGELADALATALNGTHATVRAQASAGPVRTALSANLAATQTAAVTAAVQILAADASLAVQSEVSTAAEAALQTARLGARLDAAADATAAAEAIADYRAEVLADVEAMIDASGSTDADAELFASLFVAASGGAHVR